MELAAVGAAVSQKDVLCSDPVKHITCAWLYLAEQQPLRVHCRVRNHCAKPSKAKKNRARSKM